MAKRKSIPSVLLTQVDVTALFQIHGLNATDCGSRLQGFGIDQLPSTAQSISGDDLVVLSNGPDMWLVQSLNRASDSTLDALREALEELDATVTDLSSARLIVRVSGQFARDFLKKGCPIDVDTIQTGDVVTTVIGHLGVTIHCQGDEFFLYVLQSFGTHFWEWCGINSREFLL